LPPEPQQEQKEQKQEQQKQQQQQQEQRQQQKRQTGPWAMQPPAAASEPELPAHAMQQVAPQQAQQQPQVRHEEAPERPASQLAGVSAEQQLEHPPPQQQQQQQQQQSSGRLPSAPLEPQHSASEDSLLPSAAARVGAKRPRLGGSNLRPARWQPSPEVVDLTQDDD